MARRVNYNAATKAIAANSTTVFTLADVPGNKVVAYHFSMTGAGGVVGGTGLTRIRVKNNGQAIWDVATAHLEAFIERMSDSNFALTDGTSVRFTLPFYRLDYPDGAEDAADRWQFPRNGNPTIELVYGAAGAGTVEIGYTQTDVDGTDVPMLYGSQMNIPASSTNGFFPIGKGDETLWGFSINTLGLSRLQLVVNGEDIIKCDAALANGSLIRELQQLNNGATNVNPLFIKLYGNTAPRPGESNIYADTIGTWAGATNEMTLYTTKPQGARGVA